MLKRDELLELISSAFSKEQYPENSPITQNDTTEGTEEYEIAQAFHGKSWKEIESVTVRYHSTALFFFMPQAYRYFLPAYMTLCITDYSEVDHAITALIGSLRLPETSKAEGRPYKRFLAIVSGFTDKQKNVIAHFLEYISETYGEHFPAHPPSITLDLYWKQFKQ